MTTGTELAIGAADDAVLRAVWRLHLLTAAQLTRLLYSTNSLSYAQERLGRLAAAGYVVRRAVPRPSRTGSAPLVYALGPRGKAYLESVGEVVERLRVATVPTMGLLHIQHTLAITDILILAELLDKTRPDVRLHEALHERDIQARGAATPGLQGKPKVVPDVWLDLRHRVAGRTRRFGIAIELDRGTEHITAWKGKVSALLIWAHGAAQQLFDASPAAITFAVVTTAGEPRRTALLRWTEAELLQQNARSYASMFRFSAVTPGEAATGFAQLTAAVFLGPGWAEPFGTQLVPLLGMAGREGSST